MSNTRKASAALSLGKEPLKLSDVVSVAEHHRQVRLDSRAKYLIEEAHVFLQEKVKSGDVFYGINTGFGLLSNVKIAPKDLEQLQYNLLRSHAVGTGPALEERYVRAMLLLRANALAQGHSGVSEKLIEQILNCLNHGVHPVVPVQGSVGASGDLSPLSHLALVLIGEGEAFFHGRRMSGKKALLSAGLKPIRLGPKEGLALINGTQFMTAIGALVFADAQSLCDVADFAGAMSLEAMKGTPVAFDPDIQKLRPHPGQIQSAENVLKILTPKGKRSKIAESHEGCGKVQDPYSLRCIPQVHGASRDVLSFVQGVLEREINAVTDNPLVFPESGKIISGGNFHGQIVSIAMDTLAIAMAELASISEQRLEKLVNPVISGLPAFLTKEGGLNSGYMIVQVAAASIVSENKTLCHPASVDSIPTSADKEDHVSMGAWAARKAVSVTENSRRVLSMELLAATQALDFLRPLKSSEPIEKIYTEIRNISPRMDQDRSLHPDIEAIETWLKKDGLRKAVAWH